MRRSFLPPGRGRYFNMTPLIDVVFLLIIFFMTVGQFEQEQTLNVALAEANKPDMPKGRSQFRVTLNVDEHGEIVADGQPIGEYQLGLKLLRAAKRAHAADQKVEVHIRADRLAPYAAVEPLLYICSKLSIWKVKFAVLPSAPGKAGAS